MSETQSGRILIEPHFLPSLEFFCLILPFDEIILDIHSHYIKQSYRNRSLINTANGVQTLIVPVTNKGSRTPLHEVMTSETENWRISTWRSIESAYRNSPFFEFYGDDLKKILLGNEKNLSNLNQSILLMCLEWLGLKKSVACTTNFVEAFSGEDKRNIVSPKSSFETREIIVSAPYKQVFGSGFIENLSVLDLICCCGPESTAILHQSMKLMG